MSASVVWLAAFASSAVWAQTWEISVGASRPRISGAPLGSIMEDKPKDDDTKLKGVYGYGARVTLNTPGYYGHELSYFRNRATLQTKLRSDSVETPRDGNVTVQMASYNFVIYFMPAGERFRPFITGGLQAAQYGAPRFAEWPGGGSRNYGGNYGGGLKIRLFNHALFRVDFRHNVGGKPYHLLLEDKTRARGLFHTLEGSAGLSIAF